MNQVQIAYTKLKTARESRSNDDYDHTKMQQLSSAVFIAVWEATKEINPGLKGDIDKGQYDDFYLVPSTMCWLDKVWQILNRPDQTCLHCDNVHY